MFRGTFLVLGLALIALFGAVAHQMVTLLDPWAQMVLGASALSMIVAAFAVRRLEGLARLLVLATLAGFVLVAWPFLVDRPARALAVGLVAIAALSRLLQRRIPLRHESDRVDARDAMVVAFLAWFFGGARATVDLPTLLSVLCAGIGSLAVTLRYALEVVRDPAPRRTIYAIAVAGLLPLPLAVTFAALVALAPVVASAAVFFVVQSVNPRREGSLAYLTHRPARFMVASFGALVVLGTVVLSLPIATTDGFLDGLDAAFTAVSAVCVTGLIVVDTPTAFSTFGEMVVLLLIQVGGLGIMSFSVAALALLRQRVSLRYERAAAGVLGSEGGATTRHAVRTIFLLTAITEGVTAVLLTARFLMHGEPLASAAWRGLFTAVSAFCNAGFALQTASLIPYQSDPFVLHVVAVAITVGGLGPIAIMAVPDFVRGRRTSAQARLALLTSIVLTVTTAVLIGAFEWNGALKDLSVADRLHNAWFQGVTLRTAGFNSIDFTALNPATLVVMIVAMLIGGSPGSTAGGVKTTTIAVLFLAVLATLRGQASATVAGRRMTHGTVYKAAAVLALGLASTIVAILLLILTQSIPPGALVFEVFSALGTVGLSTGATAELDDVGKIIVMGCMFSGRVGPLSVFLWLAEANPETEWVLPEEDVPVG